MSYDYFLKTRIFSFKILRLEQISEYSRTKEFLKREEQDAVYNYVCDIVQQHQYCLKSINKKDYNVFLNFFNCCRSYMKNTISDTNDTHNPYFLMPIQKGYMSDAFIKDEKDDEYELGLFYMRMATNASTFKEKNKFIKYPASLSNMNIINRTTHPEILEPMITVNIPMSNIELRIEDRADPCFKDQHQFYFNLNYIMHLCNVFKKSTAPRETRQTTTLHTHTHYPRHATDTTTSARSYGS
ncbi:unnamed protein product [Trichogramma brassicae]|uniref:Uncharacterized protein n=1 Tax=Trichogramma brassicae TaxID=86971 RepID=A0A6H5IHI9_9HYME|nr:unnamed protein product [Trichogramma brassicae]